METILNLFPQAYVRDYKNGKEIRTRNLDSALEIARKVIDKKNLNVEIFEINSQLKSFSIRQK